MELRQLRQFLQVARMASFRKAADELHMAQPPLSVSIRRLEEEIGAALFVRSRRGVQLSDVGKALLEDAQRVVHYAEHFRRSAATAASGVPGTVRLGFVGSATYTLLPTRLPQFRKASPGVTLELSEGTTSTILAAVQRGDLDAGFVRYPVIEPCDLQLSIVEPDELVAAVSAENPLARRRKLMLRDLADEQFILYSSTAATNLRAQVMLACQSAGFNPRVAQEAVQVQTIVCLVESGLGVALVPHACRHHAAPSVVFKRLADVPEHLAVAIAMATQRGTLSPATERFARFFQGGAVQR